MSSSWTRTERFCAAEAQLTGGMRDQMRLKKPIQKLCAGCGEEMSCCKLTASSMLLSSPRAVCTAFTPICIRAPQPSLALSWLAVSRTASCYRTADDNDMCATSALRNRTPSSHSGETRRAPFRFPIRRPPTPLGPQSMGARRTERQREARPTAV